MKDDAEAFSDDEAHHGADGEEWFGSIDDGEREDSESSVRCSMTDTEGARLPHQPMHNATEEDCASPIHKRRRAALPSRVRKRDVIEKGEERPPRRTILRSTTRFDLRKPLQVRKLAGEHGAGPDTHGNYRNGIVDPVGQGLRNFYRLGATYNVGGTKGVSTSDEHGTVDIIVDRFMLEVRGKYGYVPPPVCRLVSEWLERPSHKAACSDVPDAEKRELFYTQNMAAANAILPFPRPVLGDGPRRAPRRSGAAPESSSRLRLVDFLGKTSVTLDIAQYATDLGYCTTRDDVPIRQERDTCGFNSAHGACIMRMGGRMDDGPTPIPFFTQLMTSG